MTHAACDYHELSSLGLYALGALGWPERESLERHFATCDPCLTELVRLGETAISLAILTAADRDAILLASDGAALLADEAAVVAADRPPRR